MNLQKILIIDDEKLIRWSLEKQFAAQGHTVFSAETGEEGIALFEEHMPDIVFIDNKLPQMQGIEVITNIRAKSEDAILIFMTAYGSIETAVKAMKLGAFEYMSKPFTSIEVNNVINDVLEKFALKKEQVSAQKQQKDIVTFSHIIGNSPVMKQIIQVAKKIAKTETTTILLLGESGTGKDYFAKAIHNESDRKNKPFVTINCSSLPDTLLESELFGHEKGAFTDARSFKRGLFESAEGGTVFLDEIGEINPSTQVKLLNVLENRKIKRVGGTADIPINIRIIAATNKDIENSVANKSFREDLYYRLNVFQINLPPLCDHNEDLHSLALYFINQYNIQFRKKIIGLTSESEHLLENYRWPGNIRELRNVIERAVILETGNYISVENLPNIIKDFAIKIKNETESNQISAEGSSLSEMEKQAIVNALHKSGNNQTQAAKLLGISRDTLRYRMKKFNL